MGRAKYFKGDKRSKRWELNLVALVEFYFVNLKEVESIPGKLKVVLAKNSGYHFFHSISIKV
ncbi:hypothetical protein GCM10011391_20000 [Pullulanibacillus camelliae]|uniref:Uncharacterized protein n=1 Tax=Pullulanibacillus camelliae TaxID=1707096 RepID=A0A8J2YH68_9BACL|nr:hypothetical protein GCM10011391_20000 [Pullulanibacillus camelliae]